MSKESTGFGCSQAGLTSRRALKVAELGRGRRVARAQVRLQEQYLPSATGHFHPNLAKSIESKARHY